MEPSAPLSDVWHHVDCWIFDLDQTLYAPEIALFAQIAERMRAYIVRNAGVSLERADDLRRQYWAEFGTTLAGLMHHHRTDPMHFLEDVHDIDFAALRPAPALADAIAALPGRKIVHTNGDAAYARKVLDRRGLAHVFDAVFGIEHAGFVPKPALDCFSAIWGKAAVAPARAAMFEDEVRNLIVPHGHPPAADAAHIHHQTEDLEVFLSQILAD